MIAEHENYPDKNRLSVLAATILLVYALTPFIDIPIRELEIQLPTAIFYFSFDLPALISLFLALMAAIGMDWLARGHPYLNNQNTLQHVFLPALTAWVIGIPLSTIKFGWQWWVIFGFGGVLLIMLMIAEYIVIDFSDINYSLAAMVLIAVSFALFLFMLIALRGAEMRLYLLFPVVSLVMILVALRTLYLRMNGIWSFSWSTGIALIVGQFSLGLHYIPLRPVSYGLLIMIPAYGLTSVASGMEEKRDRHTLWIEPMITGLIFLALALVLDS